MRYVLDLPEHPELPVKISIKLSPSGNEVEIIAEDGKGNSSSVLGFRPDGSVVRYSGQKTSLLNLGFKVDAGGYIKMFN